MLHGREYHIVEQKFQETNDNFTVSSHHTGSCYTGARSREKKTRFARAGTT